ncbi:hypothetical protein ACOTTU_16745 [Roseobacter sp. EG26]|uniref:hypothetical protein n=1 Tax=Roseobacter sp. EG26 TaxID=3412477 RepID=UPI0026050275|nr:hypothetical protein [uncultured Roseobacter sp.]
MTPHDDDDMTQVDRLLKAARDGEPDLPSGLMARVLADADAIQSQPARPPMPARPLWARLSEALGGWQGMGGLVAATCAGVWIGFSPPASVPDAGALILGYEAGVEESSTAELTSFGWDLDEG